MMALVVNRSSCFAMRDLKHTTQKRKNKQESEGFIGLQPNKIFLGFVKMSSQA